MTSNMYFNAGQQHGDKMAMYNSMQNMSLMPDHKPSNQIMTQMDHHQHRGGYLPHQQQHAPPPPQAGHYDPDPRRLNSMDGAMYNKFMPNSQGKPFQGRPPPTMMENSVQNSANKSSVLQSVLSNNPMVGGDHPQTRLMQQQQMMYPTSANDHRGSKMMHSQQQHMIPTSRATVPPPPVELPHVFFTDANLKESQQLQSNGKLENPDWILNPPAPSDHVGFMRLGHCQDFKSKALEVRSSTTYMDQDLQQILRNRLKACLFSPDPLTRDKTPQHIGSYCEVVPLENILTEPRSSLSFGLPSQCFKAWSPRLNKPVCLRRIVLLNQYSKLISQESLLIAKQLIDIEQPNIVTLRDVFLTDVFSDKSLVLVYDYHPGSSTLQKIHMSDPMKINSFSSPFNITSGSRPHSATKNAPSFNMLPETTIWSYIIQMIHAIRHLHSKLKRACGLLDPAKILLQDGSRILLSGFGIPEVFDLASRSINSDKAEVVSRQNMAQDLVDLGKVMLCVACGTTVALDASQLNTSYMLLSRTYSAELTNLIKDLVSANFACPVLAGGVDSLVTMVAPRAFDQITRLYTHNDFLERELLNQLENDRLFRLICKLNSVLERSDESDPNWSEVSDRYLLKLFRDFVFHQVDSNGAPFLDLAHVVNCLNKMDAASSERICLVSRDNVLVVTYEQVRDWLDQSFNHLVNKQKRSQHQLALMLQQHNSIGLVDPNIAGGAFANAVDTSTASEVMNYAGGANSSYSNPNAAAMVVNSSSSSSSPMMLMMMDAEQQQQPVAAGPSKALIRKKESSTLLAVIPPKL